MKYRVLKEGVWQRGDDGVPVLRQIGDLIDLSPEAAEHLTSEGWAEPENAPAKGEGA